MTHDEGLDSPVRHGSLEHAVTRSENVASLPGTTMTPETKESESFRVERHGDIAVIIPASEVESMPENLILQAAEMVLAPLRQDPPAGLVIDLTEVQFFGSVFISFLLKCHML